MYGICRTGIENCLGSKVPQLFSLAESRSCVPYLHSRIDGRLTIATDAYLLLLYFFSVLET
jgi:hypothetical protein